MKCTVRGIGVRERKTVDEAFFVNGKWVVVEHIPADVCSHCGEVTFEADTGEKVRQLVQSGQKPHSAIKADVYEYA
jgi:HTH-type transcriptional regulator/antitoxin MqsA